MSDSTPNSPAPVAPKPGIVPKPGGELKKAREAAGLDLQFISEATLIRVGRLEALEADNYGEVGSPTYVTGYARAYAKAIGYDFSKLVHKFDEAIRIYRQSTEVQPEVVPPPEKDNKKLLALLLGGAALLVVVIIIVCIVVFTGNEPEPQQPAPTDSPRPVHEIEAKNIAEVRPDKAQVGRVAAKPAPAAKAQPAMEQAVSAQDVNSAVRPSREAIDLAPADIEAPTALGALAPVHGLPPAMPQNTQAAGQLLDRGIDSPNKTGTAGNGRALAAVGHSEPGMSGSNNVGPRAAANDQLAIVFTEDCWVRVIDAEGKRLVDKVKKAGQRVAVEGVLPFWIKLGNAEAALIELNGSPVQVNPRPGYRTLELTVGG